MSPAAKTTREPEQIPFVPEIRDEAAAMFLRGVERIAEVEKQLLDTAAQHNKEMLEVTKKAAAKIPGMPRLSMLDLVYGAMNRYVDVQKSVVDLMVEQNRIWTEAFTDRTGTVKKSGESATRAVKQAMESSFAVQKKALEHTAAHTKAVMDAARDQFGVSGTQTDVMTDTFRRGVDTIVEAQKEFLNMVVH
jgi:hypothetical protein